MSDEPLPWDDPLVSRSWIDRCNAQQARAAAAEARVAELEAALREIEKGAGEYSMDPLAHCTNTVESMKEIASAALQRETSDA